MNLFNPVYHKSESLQLIQDASNEVIMDMLNHELNTEEARSWFLQKLGKREEDKCAPFFFRNVSLVKILPRDICREIVRFNELNDSYRICKQFCQIAEEERIKRCKEVPFEYPIRSQSVFSQECYLHQESIGGSLAIQMRDFYDGDTALLKNGEYKAGPFQKTLRVASVNLIGTGNNVVIIDDWKFTKDARSVLYFKNIRFRKGFVIDRSNKVWFENCTFDKCVVVKIYCGLFARGCTFIQDTEECSKHLIDITDDYLDRVQVIDCRFICDELHDNDEPIAVCNNYTCGSRNISFNRVFGSDKRDWIRELKEKMKCGQRTTISDNVFVT